MKVKNLVLFYCLGLLVLACSHNKFVATDNNVLYAHYQFFSGLVEPSNRYYQNNSEDILSQITPNKIDSLRNHQKVSSRFIDEIIHSYLSFPSWIEKEFNHYEYRNNNKGCLLINGYDKHRNPLAIMLSYQKNQSWQIDDIVIEDLAPYNRFLSRAVCDRQQLAAIRYHEML